MWWYGSPWRHMVGYWQWHALTMGIFWAFVLVILAVAVMRIARREGLGERGSALSILEQRYARGEIGRDEYLEKKRDLTAPTGP